MGRTNMVGGNRINGIIEEYKIATNNSISAGDFVEFVDSELYEKNISSIEKSGIANAIMLNDNYVFVAYSSTANYYLAACILKIEDSNITIVTSETIINNSINMYGYKPDLVLLENNKVMIAYCGGSSYYLYGVICTIDSNYNITAGTNSVLHSSSYTGYNIHLLKINSTKVFIVYSYGSSYYVYGMLCTISNTSITVNYTSSIYGSSYSGQSIAPVLLSNGNIFIAHTYSSSYYLRASICTLDLINNTFSASISGTSLDSNTNSGRYIAAIPLEDNKVCIISPSDSNYYLMSRVYKIDGTTITFLSSGYINKNTSTAYMINAVKQNDDTIRILHTNTGGTSKGLMITTCKIAGDSVGVSESKSITSDSVSGVYKSSIISTKNDILALYAKDSTYKLYGTLINSKIKKYEKKINGIAKENGLANTFIKIYTPQKESE